MTLDMKRVRITHDELIAEAKARFGDDPAAYAFRCPRCGDIATVAEWNALGDPARAGQECIGRATAPERERAGIARDGCDWASFGLFKGPWEIAIAGDGGSGLLVHAFPLAGEPVPGGPVARALTQGATP